ncbi:TetR/AcrR family transcriptional regulator [Rhodococcus rhodnii]|uniref:TetR family transcriptional regulator n=2 Tax=Rhodococcus rhodnii TaxID=38312 RepID=R7WJR7_9NOCA|nr:TetR/AcrR family transcriptional regulator [Rhodococcus rhodnii]EOM75548.1 TetR family transcriptional regulator [Rhodococcus rhodnii LMG 5362]TXG88926.1 TetR/AcrR family transcriptional regulator [Rhodococcus rhodnii]
MAHRQERVAHRQERARRTRAALIESAAEEFARRGYAAASISAILAGSKTTKGAMYFHFESKEDLARAVLDEGGASFVELSDRWLRRTDADPFELLHGLVLDLAALFERSVIVRAEFRLMVEPEFYSDVQSLGSKHWGRAASELAIRARVAGILVDDVDPDLFTRVLSAALAGQRFLMDMTVGDIDLPERFVESLELVLRASATPEWLRTHEERGWRELTSELAPGADELFPARHSE